MIARAVLRARYHGPATVSAGVGLTLAASWSTQREQRGAFERDHIVCSEGKSYTTIDSEHAMAGTAGSDKALGHEEPTLRENVIGSYEDRIRNYSSAERVFEFFASVSNDKGTFMTPADFARSITPYQHRKGVKVGSDNFKFNFQASDGPSKKEREAYKDVLKVILKDSRVSPQELGSMIDARRRYNIPVETHLKVLDELGVTQSQLDALAEAKGGISRDSFVAMVDIDGDGLISYDEYMLFRTLLSVPTRKLSIAFRMFDRNDSGTVDIDEFESFMEVLRGETNVGRTEPAGAGKGYAEVAHRLFYPEDSDGELTLEHFTRFVRLLQREALVMQFNQWDARGNGMLSAIDFAKFLVTKVNADRRMYKDYMQRAASDIVAELQVEISLEEFLAFHEVLQHLKEMEVAMKVSGSVEGRGLNHREFVRAVQAALKGGRLRQQKGDPSRFMPTPAPMRKRDRLRKKLFSGTGTKPSEGPYRKENSFLLPNDYEGPTIITVTGINEEKPGGDADTTQDGKEEKEKDELILSDGIVHTLFALLDINGDGRLDQKEFMTLMKKQSAVPDPPRTMGVVAFMKQLKDCAEDVIL